MKDPKDYIQKLRLLADKLEEIQDTEIAKHIDLSSVSQYVFSKETLAGVLRALGGKWKKVVIAEQSEYSSIMFISDKFPLIFSIARDKVCKKTVSYDCEPIFAPGEDDTILEEVNAR